MTKICECCGKEFYVKPCRYERTRFCSRDCRDQVLGKPQLYKCDGCGKEFLAKSVKIKRKANGEQKYLCCSKACFDKIQSPDFDDIRKLFVERGYILLTKHKLNSKEKYEYICPIHESNGTQGITYNNLKNGCGCKYCAIDYIASIRRTPYEKVKAAFNRKNLFLLDQDYQNSAIPLKYICYKHKEYGIQKMTYSNVLKEGCPHCRKSKGELAISSYLRENNIAFVPYKKFDNLLGVRGGRLSYDFYLPDYNMLIEYQGEFHDGTANIQTEEDFKIQSEHDRRKAEYARENNYQFLEIWYYQLKDVNKILDNTLHQLVETAGRTQ